MITASQVKGIQLSNLKLWNRPNEISPTELVNKLGYVQLDTLSVIARSQDIVLHCRSTKYEEEQVWKDLEKGTLFEAFAHARSLVHMDEFPYYYRKMLERRNKKPNWFREVGNADQLVNETLALIHDEGEVTTSDLDHGEIFKSSWSNLSKRILDYLSTRGYIMSSRRDGFMNVYYKTTADRLSSLPDEDEIPNRMEVFWHEVETNLKILGITSLNRLLHYTKNQRRFEFEGKTYTPRYLLKKAIKVGKIDEVEIKGYDRNMYCHPDFDPRATDLPVVDPPNVFLLSPFDNVMWPRESVKEQYGFDYKFEAYTPADKRVYGYYNLPILYGSEFVGRVDPKLDRDTMHLSLKRWNFESKFKPGSIFLDQLAITLERFLKFHKVTSFDFGDLKTTTSKKLMDRIEI